VSLIENALEKMRRSSLAAGADAPGARVVVGAEAPIPRLVAGAEAASPRLAAGAEAAAGAATLSARVAPPTLPAKHMTLDLARVRAAGYLPEENVARRFADYYRYIKRPLIEKALAAGAAPEMRLILVTSSVAGDGKTFTSINLALSMARERDISVLLIDADVPRSNVSRIFGLEAEKGLTDALLDETVDPESWVIRTDIQGLELMPAGTSVENATELLASARMTAVAARLVTRNPRRVVLFDSSPLLGSSEAHALLKVPGQVIVVVRAGMTPARALKEAVGQVERGKLQGLILNQAPRPLGAGYYYGYTMYSASDGRDASPSRS